MKRILWVSLLCVSVWGCGVDEPAWNAADEAEAPRVRVDDAGPDEWVPEPSGDGDAALPTWPEELSPPGDAGTPPPDAAGEDPDVGPIPNVTADAGPPAATERPTPMMDMDCEGYQAPPVVPTPQQATLGGRTVLIWTREAPTGVLFFFHGSGGQADLLSRRVELLYFVERALAENMAVVAFTAASDQWSPENDCETNPDIQAFEAIMARAVARGLLDDDTPVYLLGYSNGGSMARRTMVCRRTAGVGLLMVAGGGIGDVPLSYDGPRPRIVWSPNRNDETVGADGVIATYDAYVAGGGEDGLLLVNEPSPMLPGHLTRIPGVSCAVSSLIHGAYLRAGIIDDDGFLLENPQDDQARWRTAIPEQARRYNDQIAPFLHELYTNHFGLSGEYADAIFDHWLAL